MQALSGCWRAARRQRETNIPQIYAPMRSQSHALRHFRILIDTEFSPWATMFSDQRRLLGPVIATLGALVCFLVTVADQPILGIGAAFWGLVLGWLTTRVLERQR